MRRPMVFISGSFAGGVGLARLLDLSGILYIAALFAVIPAVVIFCARVFHGGLEMPFYPHIKSQFAILIAFMLLGMTLFQFSTDKEFCLAELSGSKDEIKGYGLAVEKRSGELVRLTFKVTESSSLGTLAKPEKILVSIYKAEGLENYGDLVGRHIVIHGTFEIPSPARNPNCFDYRLYLKTRDIGMLFKTKAGDVRLVTNVNEFDRKIYKILNGLSKAKCLFAEKLTLYVPEENAALIQGMLFGDTNGIDEDTLVAFQKNSTAHILSVSGLHIGIIYMFMNMLARGRKSICFDLAMILFFLTYAALSSFSPSVLRAVFMITLHIMSKHLYKRYDLLSATAFTALVMLMSNPMMILNAGFQMSYLAMLSLSVFMPIVERTLKHKLFAAVSPVLAIQIGMAPLICYHFNYFSLGGFIANIPVIFISGFLIPIGICLMPLSLAPSGPLFGIGATALDLLCGIMVHINQGIYMDGGLSRNIVSPSLMLLILYYGSLFFLGSEGALILFERRKIRRIAVILLIIMVAAIGAGATSKEPLNGADLIFLDVGQGDCLFIEAPSGRTLLIDGGGSTDYDTGVKTLLPFLLKNGYDKVDMAIVTHLHQDHYGGVRSLSQEIEIGALCLYEGYRKQEEDIILESGFAAEDFVYLKQGDQIRFDEGVAVTILYPERKDKEYYERLLQDEKNENDLSLIATVEYQGIKILMTGDMDTQGEKKLMRSIDPEALKCDILKIGHHGSKYSTGDEFLKYCDPKLAVFQVGKNNFGHPHGSVIEKCMKKDIMILRNDKHGAVGIGIEHGDEQQIWVQSMLIEK